MDSPSNCYVCAVRPVLFFARFNTFTVYAACPHSNPRSPPCFRASPPLKRCAFLTVIFFIVKNWSSISRWNVMPFDDALVSAVVVAVGSSTALMICGGLFALEKLLEQGNGVLFFVTNEHIYRMGRIVDEKFHKTMKSIRNYCVFPSLAICVLFLGLLIFFLKDQILENVAFLTIVLTDASMFVMTLYYHETYFLLFGKCYKEIRSILKMKKKKKKNLTKRLQLVQKFHVHVYGNFLLLQEIFKWNLLLLFFCSCCVLIVDFFLLVSYTGDYSEAGMTIFTLCVLGSLATSFLVIQAQRLFDLSQDTLSFIFKYPTSKLVPLELAQVEMLILTLALQKPIFKASDLFVVRTSLLTSFSGTVLTYALVALQFKASWSTLKNK